MDGRDIDTAPASEKWMTVPFPDVSGVQFKHVPGFPGYCAGTDGSVWSIRRNVGRGTGKGRGTAGGFGDHWKQLAVIWSQHGYAVVGMLRRQRRLGRVILEVFRGPCPPGQQCRHLDGNKRNNALYNLCWGTAKQNAEDRAKHGTTARGTKIGTSRHSDDDVREMRRLYATGEWTQTAIGERFGAKQGAVWGILHGVSRKYIYEEESRKCTTSSS